MDWRIANSLIHLRNQVNAKFPNRSKSSDGSIGDAAHATRNSDHNPWVKDSNGQPIVTAIDITHDPANGFDSYAFADMMVKERDARVKYIISNRRIAAGTDGPQPWVWRKYTGQNPHDHHVHISVKSEEKFFDDTRDWRIDNFGVASKVAQTYVAPRATLKSGSSGGDVNKLQEKLGIPQTGTFDPLTYYAVLTFQLRHNLVDDGIVGPQTWKALG